MGESWQWALVAVIEVLAVAYIARKLLGPVTAPVRRRPDVPVASLVRKRKK